MDFARSHPSVSTDGLKPLTRSMASTTWSVWAGVSLLDRGSSGRWEGRIQQLSSGLVGHLSVEPDTLQVRYTPEESTVERAHPSAGVQSYDRLPREGTIGDGLQLGVIGLRGIDLMDGPAACPSARAPT